MTVCYIFFWQESQEFKHFNFCFECTEPLCYVHKKDMQSVFSALNIQ